MTAITQRRAGTKTIGEKEDPVPLVSIIVVVYKDRDELQQVIQSVLPHRNQGVELIVVDGGSDDGTLEILRDPENQVDSWISEPDKGIYDAMNKGVSLARGEYLLHLNAGDRLIQIPSDDLRRCLKDEVDVAAFRVLMDGKDIYKPAGAMKMRIDNCWHHQGTFYRRIKHLGYDPDYRICGDFDHNLKMLKAGSSFKLLRPIVAEHQNNGISMHASARKEIFRSIRSHFGIVYFPIAFARFKLNDLRWAMSRRLRG